MKARVVLLVAILGTSAVGAANSGKKRMREETSTEAETDTDTDEDECSDTSVYGGDGGDGGGAMVPYVPPNQVVTSIITTP